MQLIAQEIAQEVAHLWTIHTCAKEIQIAVGGEHCRGQAGRAELCGWRAAQDGVR